MFFFIWKSIALDSLELRSPSANLFPLLEKKREQGDILPRLRSLLANKMIEIVLLSYFVLKIGLGHDALLQILSCFKKKAIIDNVCVLEVKEFLKKKLLCKRTSS